MGGAEHYGVRGNLSRGNDIEIGWRTQSSRQLNPVVLRTLELPLTPLPRRLYWIKRYAPLATKRSPCPGPLPEQRANRLSECLAMLNHTAYKSSCCDECQQAYRRLQHRHRPTRLIQRTVKTGLPREPIQYLFDSAGSDRGRSSRSRPLSHISRCHTGKSQNASSS